MTTPTTAPSGQDIQELLDKAERLMQKIRDKLRELVEKINNLLSSAPSVLVPDFVVEAIQAGIRKMNEVFDKLVAKMQEFFDSPGWPWALWEAGDRWLNGVAGPSAETENQVTSGKLNVDNYWKGSAAEAYKETLGTQQPAFAAMVEVARTIKQCLHDAGWGIIKFWVAVGIGIATAVTGIIAAVAAVVGVVTAPLGPVAAAAAIVAALTVIVGSAWAAYVEFQGVKDQAEALREERRYNTAFEGDQWPRATAEGEWKAD